MKEILKLSNHKLVKVVTRFARFILFLSLFFFVSLLILEGASYLIIAVVKLEKLESDDKLFRNQIERQTRKWGAEKITHPFFGYVQRNQYENTFNNLGFSSMHDFPYKKNKSDFIIGIFGGSVAEEMGRKLEEEDPKFLELIDRIEGKLKKNVVFLNYAMAGYRQPQTLFSVAYFIEQVDAIILLDGANEFDGSPYPMAPLDYPHNSHVFMSSPVDHIFDKLVIRFLRKSHLTLARLLRIKKIRETNIASVIWHLSSWYSKRVIMNWNTKLASNAKKGQQNNSFLNEEMLLSYWYKYTLRLHQFAVASDIQFFHFFQPSQYTQKNENIFLKNTHIHAPQRLDLYKSTINKAKDIISLLKKKGVNSYDLSALFIGKEEQIYIDDFCHVNETGTIQMTNEILKIFLKE